jgi:hypothetical protein
MASGVNVQLNPSHFHHQIPYLAYLRYHLADTGVYQFSPLSTIHHDTVSNESQYEYIWEPRAVANDEASPVSHNVLVTHLLLPTNRCPRYSDLRGEVFHWIMMVREPDSPRRLHSPRTISNCGLILGECKEVMMNYLSCLKKVKGVNEDQCRLLAKSYLGCRMDRWVTELLTWAPSPSSPGGLTVGGR